MIDTEDEIHFDSLNTGRDYRSLVILPLKPRKIYLLSR
ncbi:hypothetical protein MYAER_2048 [Microcystis aeruginosa NIES-2549]|uniref:Uncharacterized protein n=1 Tax=Microcystis aeruginosa NIES-2549 TaxID=1641812 RepID=A0A0F6U491_MICAE|nr:hypothetical protein MYAER_2048 [Microcystis aeruginosa NIES-2549]AOC52794.1 hypothetical protein amyaer_2075 [Microcystis aeruginosa NIES-2481]